MSAFAGYATADGVLYDDDAVTQAVQVHSVERLSRSPRTLKSALSKTSDFP